MRIGAGQIVWIATGMPGAQDRTWPILLKHVITDEISGLGILGCSRAEKRVERNSLEVHTRYEETTHSAVCFVRGVLPDHARVRSGRAKANQVPEDQAEEDQDQADEDTEDEILG